MLDCPLHRRWIYVDAHCFHIWREHAGNGKRMLDRRKQQHMGHIGEFLSHDLLSFDHVRRYTGNRSLVADRTSQHDIDVVTDTGVYDATRQDLFLNCCGDSTRLANYIDGTHVVLVTTACKRKIEIHS